MEFFKQQKKQKKAISNFVFIIKILKDLYAVQSRYRSFLFVCKYMFLLRFLNLDYG